MEQRRRYWYHRLPLAPTPSQVLTPEMCDIEIESTPIHLFSVRKAANSTRRLMGRDEAIHSSINVTEIQPVYGRGSYIV